MMGSTMSWKRSCLSSMTGLIAFFAMLDFLFPLLCLFRLIVCFSPCSRIGCYVAVFSAVSNLRDIFYKEMSTVCLTLKWSTIITWRDFLVLTTRVLFQLNLDLRSVIKELQAQHPDKTFAVRGLQRYVLPSRLYIQLIKKNKQKVFTCIQYSWRFIEP